MRKLLIYPAGTTAACEYAAKELSRWGLPLIDHPSPEVTHLLLDVPTFRPDGSLRDGSRVDALLERLPPSITVAGGNLSHPALTGYQTLDLLQDPVYLAENAAITADCALRVAASNLKIVFDRCPVLILGWGRIGKCLAQILRSLGAQVTVAARRETDRAMLHALGYQALDPGHLPSSLPGFRLLFNTVPVPILTEETLLQCPNCVKIELASSAGLSGEDVICARGLPGIYAPESSGKLIGDRFLKQIGRV